jgi:Skp family chaperone for outer membrane proteins
MRALAFAAVLTLTATTMFGQTPPPTQTPPPVQQPAPQPAPAQPPAQPQPPMPFPEGAKIAYVNLQLVAQLSAEGKAASAKINELNQKKQSELAEKNKQLQAAQQKLAQSGTVLNDSARAQLEKDIDRMQREIQFAQENARAEINELTQDLQQDFQRRLFPIIQQVGNEKGLHLIFSLGDSGVIWGNQGLDLSSEVVKRLDAAAKLPTPAKK